MIKNLVFFVVAISLFGCNTSQPVVGNSRPVYRKPNSSVVKSVRKSVPSKIITPKKPIVISKSPSQNPIVKKIEQKYELAKEETKSSANETVYSKTEILEATTRVKVTTAMVLDYIAQYKEIAKGNMTKYGIPSSIILGQGILESGAGTGPLSVLANNHFGIKCHKEWTGPSVKYDDDEQQECFRKYNQPSESYEDHSLFLTSRSRYLFLFQFAKDDYKSWANGLKDAGYATDPKYPDKLIGIIERYQLGKYDAEVLGNPFVQVNNTLLNPVAVANITNFYEVAPGDTLYSISKKFNIAIDDLKRKNDIQDNAIMVGQNLKIK